MLIVFFILSMILAGFGKACRDTIAHHFGTSKFSQVKNQRLYKWLRSDWRDFKPVFGIIRLDAWHVADILHYIGIMLAIGVSARVGDGWLAFFFFGGAMFFFRVFYTGVLIKKRVQG